MHKENEKYEKRACSEIFTTSNKNKKIHFFKEYRISFNILIFFRLLSMKILCYFVMVVAAVFFNLIITYFLLCVPVIVEIVHKLLSCSTNTHKYIKKEQSIVCMIHFHLFVCIACSFIIIFFSQTLLNNVYSHL